MAASLSLAPNNGVGGIGSGALDAAHAAAAANAARAISAAGTAKFGAHAKARAVSQDFEAMFLNSMFSQMTAGLKGEGPFGDTPGTGVWRSMLTEQYSRQFAKAGGVGIASEVYRTLILTQAKSANQGKTA